MTPTRLPFALLLAVLITSAHAATLRVGPGEAITRIADTARLAKDGDTVEIQPGEYRGDVAVWPQKQLTIRGVGQRPVLIADGKSAEGKAIWVIRNGDIRIENIEFRGSRFENGYRGHLIKSRARHSTTRDNRIVDGPDGEASYEIDLPNGGIAHITGNTIGQSAKTQNPVLISYGAEGEIWPENSLTLEGNTLISDTLPGGWFLRVHENKFSTPPKVRAINNLTVGLGAFTLAARGEFHGNFPALPFMLNNPQALDFSLPQLSPLRWLGTDTANQPDNLKPTAEFTLPIGTRPLTSPAKWAPGALQTSQ